MKKIAAALVCVVLLGCENQQFGAREKGALGGAALGAGLGAIIGNQTGSTGAGIAIGSAVGALSGGLIGNEIDKQDRALSDKQARIEAQERQLRENRRMIDELRSKGVDARSTTRGVVVNLPDVLFEFDSSRLTSGARSTVREIARVLKDSSRRHIAVEGHTDSVGTVAYNQRLSEARARSVSSELIDQGIPRGRLSVKGFGENRPIASNNSEEGRRRNRRVEVIIENK